MGYYTNYKLQVEHVDGGYVEPLDVIRELREKLSYANTALAFDGSTSESVTWYKYQEDLMDFSENYPNVLFTLSGEGQEDGDIWRCYVLDGLSQYEKAKIIISPFDKSKLL